MYLDMEFQSLRAISANEGTSGGEQMTLVKGNDRRFRERLLHSDFFVRSELQLNIPRRTLLCHACDIRFELCRLLRIHLCGFTFG